jgi:hypothetical protein
LTCVRERNAKDRKTDKRNAFSGTRDREREYTSRNLTLQVMYCVYFVLCGVNIPEGATRPRYLRRKDTYIYEEYKGISILNMNRIQYSNLYSADHNLDNMSICGLGFGSVYWDLLSKAFSGVVSWPLCASS